MNPYEPPSEVTKKIISKELKEDNEKIIHYVTLFKDWLKCQEHLPKDIDDHLISNFIRLCKMDMKKAQIKFESFVISTVKYSNIYEVFGKGESPVENVYKKICILPKLTENGHRVIVGIENDPTAKSIDFANLIAYSFMLAINLLIEDKNAGLEAIFDYRNVTIQHTTCIDFKLIAATIDLIIKILPFPLGGLYILNLPSFVQPIYQWAITLFPEKLKKRVHILKSETELLKHFPKEVLPKDYGGSEVSCEEICEKLKDYILQDKTWLEKFEKVKNFNKDLLRKSKREHFVEMEGSFRKLCID